MAYLEPHVKLVNWSHSLRPLGTLNEFQLLGRERKIPQSRQNLGSVQVGDASIVVGEGVAGEGAFVLAGCGGVDIGFISGLRLAPIRFGRLANVDIDLVLFVHVEVFVKQSVLEVFSAVEVDEQVV